LSFSFSEKEGGILKTKILEQLISFVGRCVNKIREWETAVEKISNGDGNLDELLLDVAHNADCEDLYPRSFNMAFMSLRDKNLEKFKNGLNLARKELMLDETVRYAANSFLKRFIPISKPSMFDVSIFERYRKVKWPEGVCDFIERCLKHGGYAIAFYTLPYKKGVVQQRCLQHEYAVEKWGKIESEIVEGVPDEWYERMKEEIGEWRVIWKEVCRKGSIH